MTRFDSRPGVGPLNSARHPVALAAASAGGQDFYTLEAARVAAERNEVSKGMVFVIMSFAGRRMAKTYEIIQQQCHEADLKPHRADEGAGSGIVMNEIANAIRRAELIICDLTHERPNVYYELGFAHGVGNGPDRILLIASAKARLHFDVGLFQIRRYRSAAELREILSLQLPAMIQAVRTPDSVAPPAPATVADAASATVADADMPRAQFGPIALKPIASVGDSLAPAGRKKPALPRKRQ